MKITLTDLQIIVDTLIGTQSLSDGGIFFKYSEESRKAVSRKLINEMSKVKIDISIEGK